MQRLYFAIITCLALMAAPIQAAPPANDNTTAAIALQPNVRIMGTTAQSSDAPDDPILYEDQANREEPPSTVWYSWRGSQGHYNIEVVLTSSNENSRGVQAFVFRQETPARLSLQARTTSGDSLPQSQQISDASFYAETGANYLICLASPGGFAGDSFTLKLSSANLRPPHDDFADPLVLATSGGIISLIHATRESNEPAAAIPATSGPPSLLGFQKTAWATWKAPSTGYHLASFEAAESLARIEAFRGPTFPPLPATGGVFFPPSYFLGSVLTAGRTAFYAAKDEVIHLRVASDYDASYRIKMAAAPQGDFFAAPLDAAAKPNWEYPLPYDQLTIEPGETSGAGSQWVAWTAPDAAVYELSIPLANVYPSSPTFKTAVRVYQGTSLNSLVAVTADFQRYFTDGLQFRAVAGRRYAIQSSVTPPSGPFVGNSTQKSIFIPSDRTTARITMRRVGLPPVNDDFANASPLLLAPHQTTGTTTASTLEPGEALPASARRDSVWHRFTAPSDGGTWEIIGQNSMNTSLQIERFIGDTLATQVMQGNPMQIPLKMQWKAEPSQTYYLRVVSGQISPGQGAYTLNLRRMSPPVNDERSAATLLTGSLPITAAGTLLDALPDVPEPIGGTAWWRWVAPADGWFVLIAPDTHVSVFRDERLLGSFYTQPAVPSTATFRAKAGLNYYFRLTSYSEQPGPISLSLAAEPNQDRFAHTQPDSPISLGSSARVSSTPYSFSPEQALQDENSIVGTNLWYRWTAPFSGWFSFDSEGSTFDQMTLRLRRVTAPQSFHHDVSASRNTFIYGFTYPEALPSRNEARILHQVEAGESFLISAEFYGSPPPTPRLVQVNIRPAGPPPTVSGITLEEAPTSPERPRMVELQCTITAPNGFLLGTVPIYGPLRIGDGFPYTISLSDADRISGDAFSGRYRTSLELPSKLAITEPVSISVYATDRLGGRWNTSSPSVDQQFSQVSTDQVAPILRSVAGLTDAITLADAPQSRIIELLIADAGGSGFHEGTLRLAQSQSLNTDPLHEANVPRALPAVTFNAAQRMNGDRAEGLYKINFPIPVHLHPNLYFELALRDAAGNFATTTYYFSNGGRFASIALPRIVPHLTLIGAFISATTTDSLAPAISGLRVVVNEVTPLVPFGEVDVTFRVADALSGFHSGRIEMLGPDGVLETTVPLGDSHRVSGDAKAGQYSVKFPVAARGFGGVHFIRVYVEDSSGCYHSVLSNDFLLPDRTQADQRAPRLVYFSVSPASVDLNAGPQKLRVNLGANDDRPAIIGTLIINDSQGRFLASQPLSCERDVLNCDFEITLPQRTLLGASAPAEVVLALRDASGRELTYGRLQSPLWPSPTGLTLVGKNVDFVQRWAAGFSGFTPNFANPALDTDLDGITDLIEFALGTDPTLRSDAPILSPVPQLASLGSSSPGPTPYVSPGQDPRSHRSLQLRMSTVANITIIGGEIVTARPVPFLSFSPAAYMKDTSAVNPWKIRLESSTDLRTWSPEATTTGFDPEVEQYLPSTVEKPRAWFRLKVEAKR